jgi:hypothetical protein
VGICPRTVGLSPAFNDFVSARILAVAESVGARPSNLIHWKNLDFAGTDFFNRIGRDPSMGAGHVRVWQRSAMIGR